MANPRLLVLLTVAGGIFAFGVYALFLGPGEQQVRPSPRPAATDAVLKLRPATSSPTPAGPAVTAAHYFDAWEAGDHAAMALLVDDPPPDFVERHRRFDAELRVRSLTITPDDPAHLDEDRADVPFDGERMVEGLGEWPFSSVLRLTLRNGTWKVLWTPETLHPSLKDGGTLRLRETRVDRPATLTAEGLPFPRNSRAEAYFTGLDGTAVDLALEELPSGRVLLASPAPSADGRRTTVSRFMQAAAARALDGVEHPVAIVAVDVETRQVRAVADTLGGKAAFLGLYPPGSTFKTVTAAALLRAGLAADSPVPCPARYTIPGGRSFTNADGADHGTIPLATAFALSCNTTFAQQAHERLRGGELAREAAERFGFREKPSQSACRIQEAANPDELASDAIGQNSVLASPLCMAEVAAAVASGVWKPAIITDDPPPDSQVPLDEEVARALRTMMEAVVTDGTAARAGLPPGTAGKTGTAEVEGQPSHGWFIGYRDGLAFAVFVHHGGPGASSAAPIAARFLKAL